MTERLVIDASVLAKLYLRDEEYVEVADRLIDDFVAGAIELAAPQVILYEVPSTIRAAVLRRRLDADEAEKSVRSFLDLGLPLVGDEETLPAFVEAAYRMSRDSGCNLYDACYLTVARELGCGLITADTKLIRAISASTIDTIWLADYASASAEQ
jgi:predicted nucleic acid-binding protein